MQLSLAAEQIRAERNDPWLPIDALQQDWKLTQT